MPFDKWGIPFFYPTKTTAGVSGSGTGFTWFQNNDIFVDHRSGFIRLGKEEADVEVISTTTGEWEFPYLAEGDGLSLSGPTGHHSGGETHGCQGFTYMIDGNFEVNPPTFKFRKETYHVEYDTDPQTGTWTSPLVTQPTSTTWKGMAWVRYNKAGGRPDGGDSVVCEVWWNDNPTADITNWKMLKRTEDKGQGASNWGTPDATCDGVPYQVGTWSNIQFRFKSGASDFSLHPLIPEFEDGPVIHSIGGENMSFSDSENRGFGKRSDMPRDIEMKCLFKWDGGGAGKCRFKNLSLREIDPTKSFDDDPNIPPEGPTNTQTIQGNFTLKWDLNTSRVSACAGASGGTIVFYTITGDTDIPVSNNSAFSNRNYVSEYVYSSTSDIINKLCKSLVVPLKKVGTPGASPTITAKIFDGSGNVVYTSPTTLDPTTLTTSLVDYTFDFSTNTRSFVAGDSIGIQYTGTSSTNYIVARYQASSTISNTRYGEYLNNGTGFVTNANREFACTMYE